MLDAQERTGIRVEGTCPDESAELLLASNELGQQYETTEGNRIKYSFDSLSGTSIGGWPRDWTEAVADTVPDETKNRQPTFPPYV